MSDGATEVGAIADKIRRLGKLVEEFAPEAAEVVKDELTKTIGAGTAPDGSPWKAKKDGGKALANAAAAVDVRASGTSIIIELSGPEVYHNKGTGHIPRRQIIGVSDAMTTAIKSRFFKRFGEAMK